MSQWMRHLDNVVVIMIAVALALVMYADWFAECCRPAADVFGVLFLPAMLIASVIGNGVHNAGAVHLTIGLALELLVVWWIAKFTFTEWRSRARRG